MRIPERCNCASRVMTTMLDERLQPLRLIENRIRACEQRIRRLEGIIERTRCHPQMRFVGESLLTEFKIALRAHREYRDVLLRGYGRQRLTS